ILLAAFPVAHGMILGMLYLPVAMMLSGLMLRGAAFEFRVKAPIRHRRWWDGAFCGASLLAAVSQGVMLGRYVTGFSEAAWAWPFALGVGLALPAGYALLGAAWLIMKTTGEIRRRAVGWGRRSLRGTALGMAAISLATLMCLPDVAAKWLAMPMPIGLAPLPLATLVLIAVLEWSLRCLSRPPASGEEGEGCPEWLPFFAAVGLFGLGFAGLAYSLFPSLVAGRLDLWQAAGSPASLRFLLAGVALVLPFIVFYTVYVHWVFRGKLTAGPYQDRSAPLL
ncbi:MAG: cytochrome d ubiquinol oxidase subunit II, partial [Paludibacterium sp.]